MSLRPLLLHDVELFQVLPSTIDGAGLGLFTTKILPKHSVLGIYGGLVQTSPNDYSLEVWPGGPLVGLPPRLDDPFSCFGYINDPLGDRSPNVTCLDGGILVTSSPVSAGGGAPHGLRTGV